MNDGGLPVISSISMAIAAALGAENENIKIPDPAEHRQIIEDYITLLNTGNIANIQNKERKIATATDIKEALDKAIELQKIITEWNQIFEQLVENLEGKKTIRVFKKIPVQ